MSVAAKIARSGGKTDAARGGGWLDYERVFARLQLLQVVRLTLGDQTLKASFPISSIDRLHGRTSFRQISAPGRHSRHGDCSFGRDLELGLVDSARRAQGLIRARQRGEDRTSACA